MTSEAFYRTLRERTFVFIETFFWFFIKLLFFVVLLNVLFYSSEPPFDTFVYVHIVFLLYCTLLYIVIYFLQLTLHFKDPRPNTGSCTHFKTFLFFKTLYESAARICCFILWILSADFKSSSIKSSKYLLSIPQFCFSKELFDIWGNILVPFRRELEIIKRISPDVQLLKKCVLEPQNELSLALFPVIFLS